MTPVAAFTICFGIYSQLAKVIWHTLPSLPPSQNAGHTTMAGNVASLLDFDANPDASLLIALMGMIQIDHRSLKLVG